MKEKLCRKCNTIFDVNNTNFYFYPNKNTFSSKCKQCQRIDWIEKKEIRRLKLIELGYKSNHDYRYKNSKEYINYMRCRNFKPKSKVWNNNRNKKDIDNLNDRYIKELIVKSKGIDVKNITTELIEIYRLQLQLKREIRNATKTN
jgi:hypothetical protein